MLKLNKALDENSSLSYGASPAIWDHRDVDGGGLLGAVPPQSTNRKKIK